MDGTGIRTFLITFARGGYDDVLWRAINGVGLTLILGTLALVVAESNSDRIDVERTRQVLERWTWPASLGLGFAAMLLPRRVFPPQWDLPGFGFLLRCICVLWTAAILSDLVAEVL